MSAQTWCRFSGGALLLGGLLLAISVVGVSFIIGGSSSDHPDVYASLPSLLAFQAMTLGRVLIVAGLPGMYVQQAKRAGGIGFIGFGLTVFGVLLDLSLTLIFAIIFPWLATTAPQVLNFTTGAPHQPCS